MGKARKKKVPLTARSSSSVANSSSRPESTRQVIRQYHVLLKQKSQLETSLVSKFDAQATQKLQDVTRQIDELGGLESYQRMSVIGQGSDRGGGSEKILIAWLKESRRDAKEMVPTLRLLEVGALKPDNYASCESWIKNTPLDLNSRHPDILEQDFLLMDADEHREKWDVLSLSLVLNFVSDAKDRGRMLRLAWSFLVEGGSLFLALPLPCVANSRYVDSQYLTGLMECIGFSQQRERSRAGGKMIYLLYRKQSPVGHTAPYEKKSILRSGNRNNFCILL
ncbi:unnamed protein product [Mycena citricolor]|uniref:25S rRNA adenine-N(1) methyltransferase n=1 Tax=Mycena citricolor TaxID=2018698 RepID=A0AAD2HP91_9AGAR|nr:unnamed protein product [Mycena citricolor]